MAQTDFAAFPDNAIPAAGDVVSERSDILDLLIRCFLLLVVTLGIYRFWAKTAIRNHFWSSIRVRGEALEYTGRPTELLVGFLIALVVLVPWAVLYNLVPMFMSGLAAIVIAQGVLLLVFYFLLQVGRFRARRYRMTRTRWRGIRFGQDGSAPAYAGRVLLCWLVNIVTLGVAVPWTAVAVARYEIANSRFGTTRFAFAGRGADLFRDWAMVLGSVVVFIAALAAALFLPSGWTTDRFPLNPGEILELLILAVPLLVLFIRYRVRQFRYIVGQTMLGQTGFRSSLPTGAVVPTILLYGLSVVLTLFVGFAMVLGLATIGLPPVLGMVASGLSYVAIYGALWSSQFTLLWNNLLEDICMSLEITNFAAIEAVIQDTQPMPRHGEGLADAFDAGAF